MEFKSEREKELKKYYLEIFQKIKSDRERERKKIT